MRMDKHLRADEQYDLLFTDIPIYNGSLDPEECLTQCKAVFAKALAHLKHNRFVIVTARDLHDDGGCFIRFSADFVPLMMRDLGLLTYNNAHLLMSGNVHHSLQWFWKGDNKEGIVGQVLGRLEDCRE
jgi:hypothetical protein